MADFVKKTWACGDNITADELNRLEGGVEEALDKGYECKEGYTLLTDESVTTAQDEFGTTTGTLAYSTLIDADTVKVTFNGVEYICENRNHRPLNNNVYGAPYNDDTESYDWSEYPFYLVGVKSDGINVLGTEIAGTYQVKIEAFNETVETSECFEKAVKAVTGSTEPLIVDVLTSSSTWQTSQNTPWQLIHDEYIKGRTILFQELAMPQKKDAFGSVVSVGHDELNQKYYIDVYVQGQLRRFSASDPNRGVTYNSAS